MRSIPHLRVRGLLFDVATGRSLGQRANQQDYCTVSFVESGAVKHLPTGQLSQRVHRAGSEFWFALADGMGGHVGGETASRLACDAFNDSVLNAPVAFDGETLLRDKLQAGLDASTIALADAIRRDDELEGMGATLIGGTVTQRGLSWVSVGDSMLYLWRRGVLTKLNEDHSMAPVLDQLAERGQMTALEARTHIRRNALRSAVTGYEVELVDLSDDLLPLMADDWVLIASDGLCTLDDTAIETLVARFADASAEKLVGALLDAVHGQGLRHQDNTAVIAIRVGEPEQDTPLDEVSAA